MPPGRGVHPSHDEDETMRTVTHTETWFCDLCGTRTGKDQLTSLHQLNIVDSFTHGGDHYDQADICTGCTRKPVSQLLGWFAARRTRE